MSNTIIRVLVFLLLASSAQAASLGSIRSTVSKYLSDSTNLMLPAYVKDSLINSAMRQYCTEFAVYVDTASIVVVSGTRLYALPATYGGRIISMHKQNSEFTELLEISSDNIPELQGGVLEFFSVRQNWVILYPRPTSVDTVFYFYHRKPTDMTTGDTTTCPVLPYLQEPIAYLAAAKGWLMTDLRMDMYAVFLQLYQQTAQRVTRTKTEKAEP
ncbi:MAG TPA: hypothetical protein VNA25_27360 [Phycisphaerae bacterium]|nr:hypothetical protein [Phycisphaerae bacterium]